MDCITHCIYGNFYYTTASISGAGTAYPAGAPEYIPGFQWGSYNSIFSCLCNVLYIVVSPFVDLLSAIVLSVPRLTDYDVPLWYLQNYF